MKVNLKFVWEYDYGCFLKCFLFWNALKKYIFLFLKNYFWDPHIKTI